MTETALTITGFALAVAAGTTFIRWVRRQNRDGRLTALNIDLIEMYQPTRRHVREETRREQMHTESEAPGEPPR